MQFARQIGRWSLSALVVNATVGSGIFGNPADFVRLLGAASIPGVVLGGIATAVFSACFAEVASKIPEPGGSYIYARTVFGRFAGIQVGWFSWLARLTSAAASAALFVSYLGGLAPSLEFGVSRFIVLTLVLGFLTIANYIGVRSGSNVSTVTAVAKLSPLLIIGFVGVARGWSGGAPGFSIHQMSAPGVTNWIEALLLMSFLYGGCETAMMPMGEVRDPRRSAPFALFVGLLTCVIVFTVVQFAVFTTIGDRATTRPLADVAGVYFGHHGSLVVALAGMISTYGFLAASMLSVPRLTYSMAAQSDFPSFFARIHPVFKTPHFSIAIFGVITWLIAATGSFRVAVGLSVGARLVTYLAACAAVIPLRRYYPERKGFEFPFAPALSVIACVMALALITRVHSRELLLLIVTASVATLNWWSVTRKPATQVEAAPDAAS